LSRTNRNQYAGFFSGLSDVEKLLRFDIRKEPNEIARYHSPITFSPKAFCNAVLAASKNTASVTTSP
jgi:hypothetical protein